MEEGQKGKKMVAREGETEIGGIDRWIERERENDRKEGNGVGGGGDFHPVLDTRQNAAIPPVLVRVQYRDTATGAILSECLWSN